MTTYGKSSKCLWALLALLATALDLIPAHYPAGILAMHIGYKAAIFLALGYLIPLAFWRFNYLNVSILISIGLAVTVEAIQAVLGNGHRFSVVELGTKLFLMAIGFVIALNVRYE